MFDYDDWLATEYISVLPKEEDEDFAYDRYRDDELLREYCNR